MTFTNFGASAGQPFRIRAATVLAVYSKWRAMRPRFVKVMPRDFKRVLAAEAHARAEGREATFQELVGVVG